MAPRALPPWPLAGRALLLLLAANLVWETAQLPLYTLWSTASAGALAFAVFHCTGGDVLIAAAALALGILGTQAWQWPGRGFARMLVAATSLGLAYTIFSEWLNVEWRGAWAYADAMPLLPILGTGLAPVLQWLILPPLCLLAARRLAERRHPIGALP